MDTDAPENERRTERDPSAGPETGGGERKRSVRAVWALLGLGTALLLIHTLVVEPFRIPSASMAPTLRAGDRVLVNKLVYRFGNLPERGDVVVFDGRGSFVREDRSRADYVKRVIAVGGDRVRCCDTRGRVEVNGEPVTERYLHRGDAASAVPFDVRVEEGRLWVMGDHRADSEDSRDHLGDPGGGTVPVDRVVGRADWIVWPYERWSGPARTGGHG
jgi:signal peptidase I